MISMTATTDGVSRIVLLVCLCVQSCKRGLHASSCHGVCPLLKTCDMCTMFSSDVSLSPPGHSVPGQSGASQSVPGHSVGGQRGAGHCVWCVKEAVCYHHDGI